MKMCRFHMTLQQLRAHLAEYHDAPGLEVDQAKLAELTDLDPQGTYSEFELLAAWHAWDHESGEMGSPHSHREALQEVVR